MAPSNTWWNTNDHPRWFADINGDGKMDLIGFSSSVVGVLFSSGSRDQYALGGWNFLSSLNGFSRNQYGF